MAKSLRKKLLASIPASYAKFFKFGIVGGVGTIINTGLLWALTSIAGIYYLAAAVIATETAIVSNFIGNHMFTFKGNKDPAPLKKKFTKFQLISLFSLVGTVSLLWFFTNTFGVKHLLVWNLVAIFVMFTANFFLNKKFTWKEGKRTAIIILFLAACLAPVSAQNLSLGLNVTNDSLINITNTTSPGYLRIYSYPSGANLRIDGESFGTTPQDNLSLESGGHIVSLVLGGYLPKTTSFNIEEDETTFLNLTLRPSDEENDTNNSTNIVSKETNLEEENGTYYMYEDDEAQFGVELSEDGEVEWFVNEEKKETTNGTENYFKWTPGILFVGSGERNVLVKAKSGNETTEWNVDVRDIINPYFSPDNGTSGTVVHIYVQHAKGYKNIRDLTAYVGQSLNYSNVTSYRLVENELDGESEWVATIEDGELENGINYLNYITFKSGLHEKEYVVSNEDEIRAFYKDVPAQEESSNQGGGGGGGGDGGTRDKVKLIYVTLAKSTLLYNETQSIRLDATGGRGVYEVLAVFNTPTGEVRKVSLQLVEGERSYGTWEANFSSFTPGLHELDHVEIQGRISDSRENFEVDDRAFYVVDNLAATEEELGLVYVVLDKSVTDKAGNVSFRIDARDNIGVLRARALIERSRGNRNDSYTIDLKQISGDGKYGTWSGEIEVNEPYTSYEIKEVTLWNKDEEKTHHVSGRTLYSSGEVEDLVGYREEGGRNVLTGLAIFDESTYKRPLFPAVLGLVIFVSIAGVALTYHKIKQRREMINEAH